VFGDAGKPISGTTARVRERIVLTPGVNRIEVSATDVRHAESLRAMRTVSHDPGPKTTAGDLYFVGFGVSRYRRPQYDLAYAAKDVLDLADVLRAGAGDHVALIGNYGAVYIHTFVDDQATVANLRKAHALLARATERDTVVVLVAGHGLHANDEAADYYFATHETDIDDLARTAAPFSLVEGLLANIAPRRKLLLLDTCESGARDPGDEATALRRTGSRNLRSRALVRVKAAASTSAPARPYLLDRDRLVYADLGRRTGATVLTSSRGDELSYELDTIRNGVFTQEIMNALTDAGARADTNSDGAVSTRELAAYLARAVPAATEELQHPSAERNNHDADLPLPLMPEVRAAAAR
jgi:hypothetical protein